MFFALVMPVRGPVQSLFDSMWVNHGFVASSNNRPGNTGSGQHRR